MSANDRRTQIGFQGVLQSNTGGTSANGGCKRPSVPGQPSGRDRAPFLPAFSRPLQGGRAVL